MHLDFDQINLGIQPNVLTIALKLGLDSNINDKKLVEIFKSDPNITATILRVANSKFFSYDFEVKTLQHAIKLLGLKAIRSLTILTASKSIFAKRSVYSRFRHYVWRPSIAVALTAKEISRKINFKEYSEECFVMGLLHRIGDVILNMVDRKGFINVLNKVQNERQSFIDAERAVFQTDYTEIGFRAAQSWNFPISYALGIKYHIKPAQMSEDLVKDYDISPKERNLIYILNMAHYITNSKGFGHALEANEENFRMVIQKLNIDSETEKYFLEKYPEELQYNKSYRYYLNLI